MNILYIGDYYPLSSYRAKTTELLVNELQLHGHNIFLLSNSWCKVTKETFCGSVSFLSKDAPFTRRYYLDPLQVKRGKKDILSCYLGLGCKIVEREQIQCVIFADNAIYLPIVELLKSRYLIPCYYTLYDDNFTTASLDDYIHPYIYDSISVFDAIFTNSIYAQFVENLLHIAHPNILTLEPFQIEHNLYPVYDDNTLYILCENWSEDRIKEIMSRAYNLLTDKNTNFVLASLNDDCASLKRTVDSAEIVSIDEINKGSLILCGNELFSDVSGITFFQTALKLGLYPVSDKKKLRKNKIGNMTIRPLDNLSIITDLLFSNYTISDYFQANPNNLC